MGKQLAQLLVLLGLTQVVALGQVGRSETATPAPSAQAVLSPVSQRALTDFSISAAQPTFTWQFKAVKAGTHTAAANWNSLPAVQLTLSVVAGRARPETATGAPPLFLPFTAEAGQQYTLSLALPPGTRTELRGQMAVLYGRGERVSKRALNPAQPMNTAGISRGTAKVKDPILPLVAALAERHLARAGGRNQADEAFSRALKRHPAVTDDLLRRFVTQYNALPHETRTQQFVSLQRRSGPSGAVTSADIKLAFDQAVKTLPQQVRASTATQVANPGSTVVVTQPLLVPHINKLDPEQPLLGYLRGQVVHVLGYGFHPEPTGNKVVMQTAEPEKIGNKSYALAAKVISATDLQVSLPIDMPSAKWLLHVAVGGKKSNQVSFWTKNTAVPGAVPGPTIASIEPPNRQPLQQLLINGSNFQPGLLHRVVFANIDLPDGPSYFADAKVLSKTQLQVTVPELAIAGQHQVRVLIPGWPYSNAVTYEIAAPRYRVVFLKMICDDESDPEWCGDDELVTFWSASADGHVWTRNSQEYTGFEDGTNKSYATGDATVAPGTGGDWAEVKWALAVHTELYEWDAGDIKATQDFIGVIGEIGSYAASAAWGPEAGVATKVVAALVAEAIGRFANWLGGNPDSLGKADIFYTGAQLQSALQPGQSMDGVLNFHNSDDEGSYRLTYRIHRE